jgi:PKD repeat protein
MTQENGPPGKICPQCGALSPLSHDFCNECGAQLPADVKCPACGEIVPSGEKFCGSCGTPVSPISSATVKPSETQPAVAPSTGSQAQGGDVSVPGKAPQKLLVPGIIAVVIIILVMAVVFAGLPALSKPGSTTATPDRAVTQVPQTTIPTRTPSVAATTATRGASTQAVSIRAGFTPDKTSGPVPLTVSFTDSSSGSPDQVNWDFGDGTTSVEENPVHTFKAPGTFTVTMDATRNGQTSSKTVVITVSAAPLNANFVASPTSGNAPLTVGFTDTSTGSPTTWIWELGNGQVSYERNPETTYYAEGSYTVQLTVEKSGIQNKKSMTIYVGPAPSSVTQVPTAIQQTTSAVVTTTTNTIPAGSVIGYWTLNVGGTTQYWTFNLPVGNSIDGNYGGATYTTGTFTGTLSNGGTAVTGTYKEIISGATGTFRFTLTDANHLTGTVVKSGITNQVTGSKTPI